MTNDIIKAEILPPLPPEITPPDDIPLNDDPILITPEEEYADVTVITSEKPHAPHFVMRTVKVIFAILCTGAFLFSMYAEISSFISKVAPDSLADALAQLAFSGSYAIAKLPEKSGGDIINLPKYDNKEVCLDDGSVSSTSSRDDGSNNDDSAISDNNGIERYPIVIRDLSTNAERGLTCSNQTDYELDLNYFADSEFVLPPLSELTAQFPDDGRNPVVLIVHTHGTECYAEEGSDSYSKKDNSRTTDITKNVVAVGEVMAEYFESCGIPTIHCTEMFDSDSYIDAYENSSAAVREYLAMYPSIRYIFDVHRDSIISKDYTKYRPVTEIDGTSTAQFMCVVGTDAGGSTHTGWRDNLTFAAHLQVRLWNRSSSLPRRLSIRSASFYQQYAKGSLLLEIGSCGNTLSEAKACALIVAEEIAEIIIAGE